MQSAVGKHDNFGKASKDLESVVRGAVGVRLGSSDISHGSRQNGDPRAIDDGRGT